MGMANAKRTTLKKPRLTGKKFIPSPEQRTLVKMMAGFGIPQDRMRLGIINPATDRPIAKDVLERAFEAELEIGSLEMDAIAMVTLAGKVKSGNMTAIIWYMKNRMGWRDQIDVDQTISNPDGSFVAPLQQLPLVQFIFTGDTIPNEGMPAPAQHVNGNGAG